MQQKEKVGSMTFKMNEDTQKRFNKLSPRQQHIILNLTDRIMACEGLHTTPQSDWCSKCTQTHTRAIELFMRFEKINHLATARPPGYDNNGFSDPTITGEF